MITNWTQYWEAHFEALPDGNTRWIPSRELLPLMTGKFRRLYDRKQRYVDSELIQQRLLVRASRRYVEVTARKCRARRRRKRY
jgi:hypothetical protein